MKKFSIAFLVTALLAFSGVGMAQSLQDGINDVYAERFKSAQSTFEKLVASNPNNLEAIYWLGQTFIETNNIKAANDVYDKALLASANAPLVIVGKGHVELIENKVSEANQRFETALVMSRGKKGDDPVILNAVGRAITEVYTDKEKKGNINYAIEKLEAAAARDQKNAEIYLNLGNAYRKARPGEGGGKAFENYRKATEVNPNFGAPYYRLAQLFYSQRNWELYEQYLNDAVTKDPKFAPAYYDLYYYKLLVKKDFAAAEQDAAKFIQNTDPDPQNAYLAIQTKWAKKEFDQAIAEAKNLIAQAGDKTNPRVYRLIADAYVQKKDTVPAKEYVDILFKKATREELNANDYRLKADIYSVIPGMEDSLFAFYKAGVEADTVLENKIELLKRGAEVFRTKALAPDKKFLREKEGDLASMLVDLKPKATINEMFDVGRAYYFGGANNKSYAAFVKFTEKYPDEVYGWEWKFNNARVIDSTKKDSIAVPDALKLVEFAEKDTAKYKKQYLSAAGFLVEYYANVAKDGAKALEFVNKMLVLDPSNPSLLSIKQQLERPGGQRPASTQPKTGSSGKTDSGRRESNAG
jgi:predicted Zn-dependent protease